MKLNDLKDILCTKAGMTQWAIVWNSETAEVLESRCTVEYAIKHYGDSLVKHIAAHENFLIINV